MLCVAIALSLSAGLAAVEVNSADQAALESVKGIGPAHAKAIIEERTKNGPFKNADDLAARVKGIGNKSVVNLEAAGLTINGSSAPPTGAKSATTSAPAKSTATKATTATTAAPAAPADASGAKSSKSSKSSKKAKEAAAAASAPAVTATTSAAASAPADASGAKASKKKAKKSKAASAAAASAAASGGA
ncbi:MAG: hypothetical protein PPHEINF_0505 [uncultured Paraburkholderia sp.]|nr:MAG: hypothetical protein PPHEINF_0505 [uncultured Paraburkholderia sp.]